MIVPLKLGVEGTMKWLRAYPHEISIANKNACVNIRMFTSENLSHRDSMEQVHLAEITIGRASIAGKDTVLLTNF